MVGTVAISGGISMCLLDVVFVSVFISLIPNVRLTLHYIACQLLWQRFGSIIWFDFIFECLSAD